MNTIEQWNYFKKHYPHLIESFAKGILKGQEHRKRFHFPKSIIDTFQWESTKWSNIQNQLRIDGAAPIDVSTLTPILNELALLYPEHAI